MTPDTPMSHAFHLRSWLATFALALAAVPLAAEVNGQVTDLLTGEPIGGVRVKAAGGPQATTAADGTFTLALDGDAVAELSARRRGYWKRTTYFDPAAGPAADFDLIPRNRAFDRRHFDLLFRFRQEGNVHFLGDTGTGRWLKQPRFVVASRRFECQDTASGQCEWVEPLTPAVFRELKRRIRTAAPLLTGGVIKGKRVRRATVPAGPMQGSDFWSVRNLDVKVVVGRPVEGNSVGSASTFERAGVVERGVLRSWLVPRGGGYNFPERLFLHELGHILGFHHPLGYHIFELPTLMGNCATDLAHEEPTDDDVLHGFVLYHRPPDSGSPDVDPPPAVPQRTGGRWVTWDDRGLEVRGIAGRGRRGGGTGSASGTGLQAPDGDLEPSALLTGTIRRRGPRCPTSMGRACASHPVTLTRFGDLRVTLSWTGASENLAFQLYSPQTGYKGGSYVRNGCGGGNPSNPRTHTFENLAAGDYELRVLHWSGRRAQTSYTLDVR